MPLTTASYHLRPLRLTGLENGCMCPLWQGLTACLLLSAQHPAPSPAPGSVGVALESGLVWRRRAL